MTHTMTHTGTAPQLVFMLHEHFNKAAREPTDE